MQSTKLGDNTVLQTIDNITQWQDQGGAYLGANASLRTFIIYEQSVMSNYIDCWCFQTALRITACWRFFILSLKLATHLLPHINGMFLWRIEIDAVSKYYLML